MKSQVALVGELAYERIGSQTSASSSPDCLVEWAFLPAAGLSDMNVQPTSLGLTQD